MILDRPDSLSTYAIDGAVEVLAHRAEHHGDTYRCPSCGLPWAESPESAAEVASDATPELSVVVFDQHLGHDHAQDAPVAVGLAHTECQKGGALPFTPTLLDEAWHLPVQWYGLRDSVPAAVLVIADMWDVVISFPDGATVDPGFAGFEAGGEMRVDGEALAGRVRVPAKSWIDLDESALAITVAGVPQPLVSRSGPAEAWYATARDQGAALVVWTPVTPIDPVVNGEGVLSPDQLGLLLDELSVEPTLFAASLPVRDGDAGLKGLGRNERCACGSGRKYKQCCG